MKSLFLFALSAVATAAMALSPAPDPEITISGTSVQTVSVTGGTIKNYANTDAEARQNLATNAGAVTIGGASNQTVNVGVLATVQNEALGQDAFASQNLSSNVGTVKITGSSTQMTDIKAGGVWNKADGARSVAVQNLASNNSCYSCGKVSLPWPF